MSMKNNIVHLRISKIWAGKNSMNRQNATKMEYRSKRIENKNFRCDKQKSKRPRGVIIPKIV